MVRIRLEVKMTEKELAIVGLNHRFVDASTLIALPPKENIALVTKIL